MVDYSTVSLNPDVHLRFRRMRYRVATQFYLRTIVLVSARYCGALKMQTRSTHFFMIMYLRALPRVWSSDSNSKDAAVSVAPGSYIQIERSAVLDPVAISADSRLGFVGH